MKKQQLLAIISAGFISLGFTTSAEAALVSRLGGLAYYDNVANLTWLADANAVGTTMNWAQANEWAAGLNIAGVTGWRLPAVVDVGNDGATVSNVYKGVDYGYNITAPSELSNMFYTVLGNTAYYDTSGGVTGCHLPDFCLTNTGPFSHLESNGYWSATDYAGYTSLDLVWAFDMRFGSQYATSKEGGFYAWAVKSGDVNSVPVPPAVWLFGSGLLGLIGIARRKNV